MSRLSIVAAIVSAVREFFIPTYHPERHYMRGPGPACQRRTVAITVDRRH